MGVLEINLKCPLTEVFHTEKRGFGECFNLLVTCMAVFVKRSSEMTIT